MTSSEKSTWRGVLGRIWDAGFSFTAYSAAGSVLNGISGLVVLRFVDPIAMGWWNASQLMRVPFDLLRAGILSGMNREYPFLIGAGKPDEAKKVLETGLAHTLATVVASQLGLGAVLLFVEDRNPMLLLGLITTGVTWGLGAYGQYVRSALRTSRHFTILGRVGLTVAVVDTCLVALVWRFGFAGLVVRALVSATATAVLLFRQRPTAVRPRMDWAVLAQLFRFGRHPYLTGFVLLLGAQAERLMLLSVPDGLNLLGLFTPALAAASLLQIVPGSLQSFFYPKIIEEYGRNGDVRLLRAATLALIKKTFVIMIFVSAVTALGFAVLVDGLFPRYQAGQPATLIVCASGPFLACRMASTYFAALHRWPEYYAYTIIQCVLPFGLIAIALGFLAPLPAVALGSGLALAAAGATLVALMVHHGKKNQLA